MAEDALRDMLARAARAIDAQIAASAQALGALNAFAVLTRSAAVRVARARMKQLDDTADALRVHAEQLRAYAALRAVLIEPLLCPDAFGCTSAPFIQCACDELGPLYSLGSVCAGPVLPSQCVCISTPEAYGYGIPTALHVAFLHDAACVLPSDLVLLCDAAPVVTSVNTQEDGSFVIAFPSMVRAHTRVQLLVQTDEVWASTLLPARFQHVQVRRLGISCHNTPDLLDGGNLTYVSAAFSRDGATCVFAHAFSFLLFDMRQCPPRLRVKVQRDRDEHAAHRVFICNNVDVVLACYTGRCFVYDLDGTLRRTVELIRSRHYERFMELACDTLAIREPSGLQTRSFTTLAVLADIPVQGTGVRYTLSLDGALLAASFSYMGLPMGVHDTRTGARLHSIVTGYVRQIAIVEHDYVMYLDMHGEAVWTFAEATLTRMCPSLLNSCATPLLHSVQWTGKYLYALEEHAHLSEIAHVKCYK